MRRSAGRTHQARHVLVAAGAYSNRLLPEPLAVALRPEVVVLGEVSDEQATKLAEMPAFIHLLEHPGLDDVYVNPPMRYPDGKTYIKIGGSHQQAEILDGPEAVDQWMRADVTAGALKSVAAMER